MNRRFTLGLVLGVLVAAVAATGIVTYAQVKRPYRDGTVWQMNYIRMKPGMESAYLTYLAGDWKKEQESLKKEGLIVSYKVITSEGHSPTDWNIVLMTEYKNLAAMEASADKAESVVMSALSTDDQKMRQGYKDRLEIRDIIGDRLGREIVLEPKM